MIQGLDRKELDEALARVLQREQIPRAEPEPHPILQWLRDWMNGLDIEIEVLRWILIGLLALLLARILWRLYRVRRSDTWSPQAGGQERVARIRALRIEARQAEAAGDRRAALRLYFRALVVGLGVHGDLHYRSAWTLREILERGQPKAELRPRLEEVLLAVEPRSFGAVPTQIEDVARVRELCHELLGPEPAERGALG